MDDSGYAVYAIYVACEDCRTLWFDSHNALDFSLYDWVSLWPSHAHLRSFIQTGNDVYCSDCIRQVGTVSNDGTFIIYWNVIEFVVVNDANRDDLP